MQEKEKIVFTTGEILIIPNNQLERYEFYTTGVYDCAIAAIVGKEKTIFAHQYINQKKADLRNSIKQTFAKGEEVELYLSGARNHVNIVKNNDNQKEYKYKLESNSMESIDKKLLYYKPDSLTSEKDSGSKNIKDITRALRLNENTIKEKTFIKMNSESPGDHDTGVIFDYSDGKFEIFSCYEPPEHENDGIIFELLSKREVILKNNPIKLIPPSKPREEISSSEEEVINLSRIKNEKNIN